VQAQKIIPDHVVGRNQFFAAKDLKVFKRALKNVKREQAIKKIDWEYPADFSMIFRFDRRGRRSQLNPQPILLSSRQFN
jgi:hypothetical protein